MLRTAPTLIWAQDANGAIGKGGGIPWSLPEDLKRFRRLTTGGAVIMGRRTWDSRGRRALPDRYNIVVSTKLRRPEHAGVARSLSEALKKASGFPVFIIGGSRLYTEGLELTDRILVTEVDLEVEGADAFAPAIPSSFRLVETSETHEGPLGISYRYKTYEADRGG